MTMEHVYDPLIIAVRSATIIKTNGAFVTVTHDYNSFIIEFSVEISNNRYLNICNYFQESICELFKRANFDNIGSKAFINHYSFNYGYVSPL